MTTVAGIKRPRASEEAPQASSKAPCPPRSLKEKVDQIMREMLDHLMPKHPFLRYVAGRDAERRGDLERAVEHYQKSLSYLPSGKRLHELICQKGYPSPLSSQEHAHFMENSAQYCTATPELDYESGLLCKSQGNMDEAGKWFKLGADGGDAKSEVELAYLLEAGEFKEALLLSAALKKEPLAFALLGREMVSHGPKKAYLLIRQGAQLNDLFAQSLCRRYGIGKSQDLARGFNLGVQASQTDHSAALNEVGFCYEHGKGVEKNPEEALRYYMESAKRGFIRAQVNVGACFYLGIGVAKDPAVALLWFDRAAKRGDAAAQNNLGHCLENGIGAPADPAKAFRYYQAAAGKGDLAALNNLGRCFKFGIGTEINFVQAFNCYTKAAEEGCVKAQYNLACLYFSGQGCVRDPRAAMHWLHKSALQGCVNALYALALYYEEGDVLPQDISLARHYYEEAAARGCEDSQKALAMFDDEPDEE
jgi:TPR repeat protein